LNSVIGLVLSFLTQKDESKRRKKLELIFEAIQQKLFDMGSELATLQGDEYEGQITIKTKDTEWLEEIIDAQTQSVCTGFSHSY
jgi:cob(I)alamin adenosyltransferase